MASVNGELPTHSTGRVVPAETADPGRRHDHVVEPHVAGGRVRDVVLQPEVVQLQRRAAPELEAQAASQSEAPRTPHQRVMTNVYARAAPDDGDKTHATPGH